MQLDALARTVELVRTRPERFRELLSKNEAQARISLINPVLRALGWPVDDPAWVQVEFRCDESVADYVVFVGERPLLVLEAKALGVKLDIAQSAVLSIAWKLARQGRSPKWVGTTDGLRWAVYDPHQLTAPVAQVDLRDQKKKTPAELAVELARLLWRDSFTASQPPVGPPPLPEDRWLPLAQFFPVPKQTAPPELLRFPDGVEVRIAKWREVLVAVAEWLVARGALTAASCPVPVRERIYLVHTEPRHKSGQRFSASATLPNGLVVNLHFSAEDLVRHSKRLLERFGVDPSQVLVKTTDRGAGPDRP